ncbi:MAG: S-adenosylmethionine decarboxylase [Candidatus Omnitrophica bacterium]|nr:S-adenosylmethionine decarboxylase [Candidatus Omnitrophota bacterium]MBI3010316.1 S-adenosylmethionine decarboxylase [Candidatus Omnitrophota bacterium]
MRRIDGGGMPHAPVCEVQAVTDTAKTKRAAPFGYQLLLDLYDCKKGACDDLGLCYQFLEQVVSVLKVEPQSPPFIFRTDGKRYPDKAGLSGWIPLVESGIQIHTLTPKEFISIDIYSCRQFDVEPLKTFVRSYFRPQRMDEQFLERGLDYNK